MQTKQLPIMSTCLRVLMNWFPKTGQGFRCILACHIFTRRYGIMLGMRKQYEAAFKAKVALRSFLFCDAANSRSGQ